MIIKLEGVEYDCDYAIEEHGYPSNGWDDPGAPTVVGLISANGILSKDLGPHLVELLEEKIAETIDTEGPDDDYGGDY